MDRLEVYERVAAEQTANAAAWQRRASALEAALRRIADHPNWYTDSGDTQMCDQSCMDQVIAVAQAALKGDDLEN